MKVGKAKYGGEYVKKKYWKLKDGESTFRILPPIGNLADDGRWSMFYKIHYGYRNSKDQMRVFQSSLVQNYKTKMIEVPDAALERIQLLKGKLEQAKKAGNKAAIDELNKYVGPKGQFNLDNNHYVNAMDEQGNIGILKLRHRAKLALDATIKRLRDGGVDPLSAEDGRFFVFRRSGNALDTSFQVDILKQKLNVPNVGMVEKEVVHVLTDEILKRLSSEAAELDKLFKKPSADEIARIVKEGKKAVDEILDAKAETTEGGGGYSDDGGGYEDESEDSSYGASQAGGNGGSSTGVGGGVGGTYGVQTSVTPPAGTGSTQGGNNIGPTPGVVTQSQTSGPIASKPVEAAVVTQSDSGLPKTTAETVNDMDYQAFLKTLNL